MHDGYKVSIFTTARKCFSVVFSAYVFKHHFTGVQWAGALLVMASTVGEMLMKSEKKKVKG